jgi:ribosomal protein S18 acetylase RimI-like enzyme
VILKGFLSTWPYKPHRWGSGTPGDRLNRLLLSRITVMLEEQGVHAWSALDSGRFNGLSIVRPLAWDSRVLEMPAGRLELFVGSPYAVGRRSAEALLDASIRDARQQGLRHLSIRVDAADDALIHSLEAKGFLNVDALMTFATGTGNLPTAVAIEGLAIRPATPADVIPIAVLAAEAFRDGRFRTDPSLSPELAQNVYRTWAAACCDGSAADAAIVAVSNRGPVGFIACRMLRDTAVHLQCATGTIPLVAADESVRGQGLGRALVAAAANWFRQEQAVMVEIGTQLRNVAAARLYNRCGFKLVAGSLSFRLMIES